MCKEDLFKPKVKSQIEVSSDELPRKKIVEKDIQEEVKKKYFKQP